MPPAAVRAGTHARMQTNQSGTTWLVLSHAHESTGTEDCSDTCARADIDRQTHRARESERERARARERERERERD